MIKSSVFAWNVAQECGRIWDRPNTNRHLSSTCGYIKQWHERFRFLPCGNQVNIKGWCFYKHGLEDSGNTQLRLSFSSNAASAFFHQTIATGSERAVKLHSKQHSFRFYVELAAFERHVIFNLQSWIGFNRVNIANPKQYRRKCWG